MRQLMARTSTCARLDQKLPVRSGKKGNSPCQAVISPAAVDFDDDVPKTTLVTLF